MAEGSCVCELCDREVAETTRHHLIPRSRHANKRNRKHFERDDVRTRLLNLCRPCHAQIHAVLTNKQLEHEFNTREKLLAHPEVAKFVQWISRRDPKGRVRVRRPER